MDAKEIRKAVNEALGILEKCNSARAIQAHATLTNLLCDLDVETQEPQTGTWSIPEDVPEHVWTDEQPDFKPPEAPKLEPLSNAETAQVKWHISNNLHMEEIDKRLDANERSIYGIQASGVDGKRAFERHIKSYRSLETHVRNRLCALERWREACRDEVARIMQRLGDIEQRVMPAYFPTDPEDDEVPEDLPEHAEIEKPPIELQGREIHGAHEIRDIWKRLRKDDESIFALVERLKALERWREACRDEVATIWKSMHESGCGYDNRLKALEACVNEHIETQEPPIELRISTWVALNAWASAVDSRLKSLAANKSEPWRCAEQLYGHDQVDALRSCTLDLEKRVKAIEKGLEQLAKIDPRFLAAISPQH